MSNSHVMLSAMATLPADPLFMFINASQRTSAFQILQLLRVFGQGYSRRDVHA